MSVQPGDNIPETAQVAPRDRDDLPRVLVVMNGPDVLRTPLPSAGALVIGRSRECDVVIDDPSVSRQHARLHVGAEVVIEDLGSSNGTLVGGRPLAPHARVPVHLDELLRFGVVAALVQRVAPTGEDRVVAPERLRAAVGGRPVVGALAAVRIALAQPVTTEVVAALAAVALRDADRVAQLDPTTLELALVASSADAVEDLVARFVAACRERLGEVRVATRLVPRDGADPVAALDELAAALGPGGPPLGDEIIVQSPAMRALYALADQVAEGQLGVLVVGETGVGKEHLAERIHRASSRAHEPFVRINCAAFAETLFEAEFFGYEKGAFTGATQAKTGLLEHAGHGTVFLDEVGELPLPVQAKFLRVLEDRQLMRVGSLRPRPVHARFVAATNRALEREVERGSFRKDLYFRLAGVVLAIPPLRERHDEILPLARRFVAHAARALGRTRVPAIAPASRDALLQHGWDGNVRELRNVMERAVLLCRGEQIEPPHLLLPVVDTTLAPRATPPPLPAAVAAAPGPAAEPGGQHERLLWALEQSGGNQKAAARLLGISRQTIGKWIDKYGVTRPRRSRPE